MIKVNYNPQTTLVTGYYPDAISYSSIPEPYIEISEEQHELAFNGKQMCVINNIFQEYIPPYEKLLRDAKESKKKRINALRNSYMAQDVLANVNSYPYYFQRDIQSNLAWINNIEGNERYIVTNWITSDNSIVNITTKELLEICKQIRERDTVAVINGRHAKNKVDTMTTIEEVENFDIEQVFEVK